jgi:hypothetical protein
VIDSDSSIQKSALFTKLKSGYPVRLMSVKEDAKKLYEDFKKYIFDHSNLE